MEGQLATAAPVSSTCHVQCPSERGATVVSLTSCSSSNTQSSIILCVANINSISSIKLDASSIRSISLGSLPACVVGRYVSVALQWHFTVTIVTVQLGPLLNAATNCELDNYSVAVIWDHLPNGLSRISATSSSPKNPSDTRKIIIGVALPQSTSRMNGMTAIQV